MNNSEKPVAAKAQVPGHLNALGDTLDDLEKTIGLLRSRLQSVLRDDIKDNTADPKEEEEKLVDIADIIRKYRRRTRGAIEAISTITRLLEL